MIRFCCTNRLESLVDALADTVAGARASLFDPISLVVPNPLIESLVKQGLARRLGIAAHIESSFLRGFLYDVARASRPDVEVVDRDRIEGELLALFHDPGALADPSLAAVRDYLSAEGDALDRKRVQLASAVAALFDEYTFTRPEMLDAWRAGKSAGDVDPALQTWQRALWRALHGAGGAFAARGAVTLPELFAHTPERDLRAPAAHLFGISYVARLYGPIFAKLARVTDLWVYSLSASHLDRLDEPEGGALDAWARPGRENAAMLLELAAGDADARFVDPVADAGTTTLAVLQQRILERQTTGVEARTPDDSFRIAPAPDARRELETIAAEIWAAVRAEPDLSFADFAVVVPPGAAATYLPLAQEVFEAASRLPCTVLDLPRAGERRIFDAAAALLELPLGQLARPEVLRVAMHPAIARRFPEVDPEDWLALCEDLEIVRGADAAGLPRTYLDRDRISWDQGLRRLAMGAFLSGPRSGEDTPFPFDDSPFLPAELSPSAEPAARALGILARELIAYADAAQRAAVPFAEHAALLRRVFGELIQPETPDEEAALGDLFAAVERAQAAVPPALPVSFRVASELIRRRLGDLPRLGRPPEGVTVASFVPMRALPFHTIYMAGLDERVFPSAAGWAALDLRAGSRRPGDVTPREQDQHIFLETLVSARRHLVLSYVARDPVTGDPRGPSSVVEELRVAAGAPEIAPTLRPAARHLDDAAVAVIPTAARERRAVALGRSLREAAGGVPQLPPLGELRAALPPASWAAVTGDLGWLAPPAHQSAAQPAARLRRPLTLLDLRRFLECPLQASARLLLPIRDEGDAGIEAEAALREYEPLDESRMETVPFLRELAAGLFDGGDDPREVEDAYDRAAELKRLDGMLADGLFGRAARQRHVGLLSCWRAGVRSIGPLVAPPQVIWLGAAPESLRAPLLRPALALEIGGQAVPLGGRTELVAAQPDGTRVVLSLIASVNPRTDCPERDFLPAFFTHLALTMLDDEARPGRAITLRPKDDGSPRPDQRLFAPFTPEAARAVLTELAGELVRDVHPYFFPCEGVFHRKKQEAKGEPGSVRASILLLRDDNWTRFASDTGPVPAPRDYPVPDEKQAEVLASRRFGCYFACIADSPQAIGRKGARR